VTNSNIAAAVVGASGYTGVELLRLIAAHPHMSLAWASGDSQAGSAASAVYPSLAAQYPDLVLVDSQPERILERCQNVDVVFLGLPHEVSLTLVPELVDRVQCVVDLSAAFRLKDVSAYPTWYGFDHDRPDVTARAVYGLPEIHRQDLVDARLIATPGCYVTAATLALAPLVRLGVIDTTGVIVDAASGVSGAGRVPKSTSHFATVDEDFTAYGLLDHRHTPEMQEQIGADILFTPHLAPMNRGILATCYARPAQGFDPSTDAIMDVLTNVYESEPFVVVSDSIPSTKATLGSNAVHITARFDERTGTVVVISALDNLCKGASGGALQAANVALGLPEESGLSRIGLYP
jgi:N-acetyl-gamma-glutamyl-phosphate reductase